MSGIGTLGVILAGGAGSRVGGADKGLLAVHGAPVVEHVAAALRPQCDDMLIVANRNRPDYARVARVVGDEIPGHAGPLAGIAAALALVVESGENPFEDCRWLLTVPVDCPDFPGDVGDRLRGAFDGDARLACAYARDERRLQPLFALYSLASGGALLESARAAASLHGSVLRWHMGLAARAVEFRGQAAAFHNLNAPEDFREYERSHAAI
ncbi:MAG TPA: NTP transferase domain-containing protein [Rhodanobacteraceae bacterium]|jgi:molybdenum cofactor guanylyltransferase|nr:NTP transferase domain-containing protein [Rhodanobacteraceae bacterium]